MPPKKKTQPKRKNPGRAARKKIIKTSKLFKEDILAETNNITAAATNVSKNWILAQKSLKPKFPAVEDLTDEEDFDDGNEFNAVNELVEKNLGNLTRVNRKKYIHDSLFECEWKNCGMEFETDKDFYIKHIKEHLEEFQKTIIENENFNCEWELCTQEFKDFESFERHIYYHTYHQKLKTFGESLREKVDFPSCANDSSNRNTIPEIKTNYICQWRACVFTTCSILDFHQHIDDLHVNSIFNTSKTEKPCYWVGCTKLFKGKYKLKEHIRSHSNEKFVGCSNCGALFSCNTKLFDHCKRQIINNTEEFQCSHCFKLFTTERILRDHWKSHINRFKCTMCDMTCPSPYNLAKHIRNKHFKEKPFKCNDPKCKYSAVSKYDVDKHFKLFHSNTHAVYQCQEDDCTFSTNYIHVFKKHFDGFHGEGITPFACHCCEQTFTAGYDLSQHLIGVHGFQLPSGHSRFIYKEEDDGYKRLQTVRIESLEVTEQIISTSLLQNKNETNASYKIGKLTDDGEGLAIKINKCDSEKSFEEVHVVQVENNESDVDNEDWKVDSEELESEELDAVNPEFKDETSSPPASIYGTDNCSVKTIDNFKVMRKYLKKTNEADNIIEFTVNNTDADGNIIKTEKYTYSELVLNEVQ